MYYIYINYNNIEVLKDYLEIIKKALESNGEKVLYTKDFKGIHKKDTLIIPLSIDSIKMYFKGYQNIIIWQQGLTSEESYFRHRSRVRKRLLSYIDRFVMNRAKYIFFVSNAMKEYYEKNNSNDYSKKSYIMPCFNETFNPIAFETEGKYKKKIFTYVGSLEVWQCFDETLRIYKEIENRLHDTELRVYTFSVNEAREKIIKQKIRSYSVECVPKNAIAYKMGEITYGFVIRQDHVINRVATPTKLSSYLASGVIPIFSDCLNDFYKLSKSMKYVHPVSSNIDIDGIIEFCKKPIAAEEVKKEYEKLFFSYYSREKHIKEISRFLNNAF